MKRNAKIWSLLIFISIGFFIPSDSYGDFTTDQNSFDFFVQTNDILFLNNFESEKNDNQNQILDLLIEIRDKERENKNYIISDFIRDKLNSLGINIEDKK